MNCDFVRTHIQDYLDGRLVALDRNAFVRHVDECPACEAEVMAYREVFSFLRDEMRREPAPPRVRYGVLSRLRAEGRFYEPHVPALLRVLERFLALPAAAKYPLAAVALVASLYFPLAALLGLARGFAISYTDFMTRTYSVVSDAVGGVSLIGRLIDNLTEYARVLKAVVEAFAVTAQSAEGLWLLGALVAGALGIALAVSVVARRKRSAHHVSHIF